MNQPTNNVKSTSPTSSPEAIKLLMNAPFQQMVQKFAEAVQEAQIDLDKNSAATFEKMADPESGVEIDGRQYSLVELGLSPTFYHFQQSEMEARLSIDIRRGKPKLEKKIDMPNPEDMIPDPSSVSATPVDSSVANKYSYPPGDSSSIQFRLVSVPPPSGLGERLAQLKKNK